MVASSMCPSTWVRSLNCSSGLVLKCYIMDAPVPAGGVFFYAREDLRFGHCEWVGFWKAEVDVVEMLSILAVSNATRAIGKIVYEMTKR